MSTKADNRNYDERPVGELILIGGNKFVHWTKQTRH